jgi:hypothetical protein
MLRLDKGFNTEAPNSCEFSYEIEAFLIPNRSGECDADTK